MKLFRSQSKSQSNILPFYLKSDWLTCANISQYLLKAISIKIKWMTGNDWDFNFLKTNSKQFKTIFALNWLNKGLKIAWTRTLPVEMPNCVNLLHETVLSQWNMCICQKPPKVWKRPRTWSTGSDLHWGVWWLFFYNSHLSVTSA